MGRYFGTDGIRGRYEGALLNANFVRRVGFGLKDHLRKMNAGKPLCVVLGRDTRQSGEWLEKALLEGLTSGGIHVYRLDQVPTPAVSMMVRDLNADLGIMLTASHNPPEDNGIKLFDRQGLKLEDEEEAAIEAAIDAAALPDHSPVSLPSGYAYDGRGYYMNYIRSLLHQNCLWDWKVVIDTANGATCETTPAVFRHLGATIVCLGCKPDGHNINVDVGSEHPEALCKRVRKEKAHLGLAHDGDGDRLVVCDEKGHILAGEELLGIIGLHYLSHGQLKQNTLVTTVHSNTGLDKVLADHGGKVIRTPVGDRHVLHAMLQTGSNFGGESSGHYLFTDNSCCGDGLLTAIKLIEVMLASGRPLSELRHQIKLFPQAGLNVRVATKPPIESLPTLFPAIQSVEEKLAGKGRVLVRYSGTESKLRLLVEAPRPATARQCLKVLEAAAQKDLTVLPSATA